MKDPKMAMVGHMFVAMYAIPAVGFAATAIHWRQWYPAVFSLVFGMGAAVMFLINRAFSSKP